MFKTKCPKCNNKVDVINGRCSECNYDISEYMKEIGLYNENQLVIDKMYICPHCGTIDAGEKSIRLKCYECGTPYKYTNITRKQYWQESGEACINGDIDSYEFNLIKQYVEDTIDWDIYNARKDNWNKNQEQRHKHQQQKQAEENARQDAINHPKCPKCGSTAITAGQRGYSFFTGFLGNNKTVNRCANCGHTWKPGK